MVVYFLFRERVSFERSFMDVGWQWGPHTNPADYKDGPQAYDAHLYYAYGVRFVWIHHHLLTAR